MSAVDNAKKYLSLRPPMENKTTFALHPDVLVEGLLDEIERLRKALQLIAAPSKVVVKGEEAVVALQLLLSSHRRTALKALGGGE